MKFLIALIVLFNAPGFAQTPSFDITVTPISKLSNDLLGSQNSFIENIGQYGETMTGFSIMGKIQYGFEGFRMPVLFTSKGLIHLQRKIENISKQEEEKLEKKGIPEEEIERKRKVTDKTITMEWLGASPQPEIVAEEITPDYHTYGYLKKKAKGFKRITYKNLYPGIDVIYHFTNSGKIGFEYSVVVKPGADLSIVKMKYGGDVENMVINKNGNLVIQSALNEIIETSPVSFSNTTNELELKPDEQNKQFLYSSSFQKNNNIICFTIDDYDRTKTLVVDPFISTTGNLTGANNGIAKDIDFDYFKRLCSVQDNVSVSTFSATSRLRSYVAELSMDMLSNSLTEDEEKLEMSEAKDDEFETDDYEDDDISSLTYTEMKQG